MHGCHVAAHGMRRLFLCVWTPSALSQLVCCMGAATGEACTEVACNLELVMRCPFQQFAHSYQGMSSTHNSRPTPLVPSGLHA
jgi:hypothetical protein